MTRRLVGIDLGGTSIRAAVAVSPGVHDAPVRYATPAAQGPDAVLDACATAARMVCGGKDPDGVAIGVPGPLDPVAGIVYDAPHIPGFGGLEVGRLLGERLGGCPVAIENDAKVAAYAEYIAGAGAGANPFLFVTVSTGIGGGIVIDGEIQHGIAGTAGEIGHTPASPDGPACSQGHVGCLEGVAAGTGIARRAATAIEAGEATSLRDVPEAQLDAVAVEKAARAGDVLARRLFDEAGRALGRALGGLVNVLSPQVIVIGGGLINTGDLLFDPLNRALPEMAFSVPLQRTRVVTAALGTDAGLVGATAWALRRLGV